MGESIGQLISRRLADLDISKAELAKRVGVSRSYIGALANETAKTQTGFHRPRPDILTKLAKHLKISESEVLAAVGYQVEVPEEFDLDEKITVSFKDSEEWDEERRAKAIEQFKTVLAGIKAREREAKEEQEK